LGISLISFWVFVYALSWRFTQHTVGLMTIIQATMVGIMPIFLNLDSTTEKTNACYLYVMEINDLITIDRDILGGEPLFKGTRVPIYSLFGHLEAGVTLNEFLEDFPTVTRAQAVAILEIANKMLSSKKLMKCMRLLLDENLPKRLKQDLLNHEVFTVRDMKWAGVKNGKLLELMLAERFSTLLTFDKNLQHQQNFSKYTVAVIVLVALINTYEELGKLVPRVQELLSSSLLPGPVIVQEDPTSRG
jgi:uncharacterized protein (DUF433 family)